MPSGKKIVGKWEQAVRDGHAGGLSIAGIAKKTGVAERVVEETAARLGLSFDGARTFNAKSELMALKGKAGKPHDLTVMALALEGVDDAGIAKETGLTIIQASAAVGRLEMHGRRAMAARHNRSGSRP